MRGSDLAMNSSDLPEAAGLNVWLALAGRGYPDGRGGVNRLRCGAEMLQEMTLHDEPAASEVRSSWLNNQWQDSTECENS